MDELHKSQIEVEGKYTPEPEVICPYRLKVMFKLIFHQRLSHPSPEGDMPLPCLPSSFS